MTNHQKALTADAAFTKQAAALRASVPAGAVRPLDGLFDEMQRFTSIRRREVRVALLDQAGRSSAAWQAHRAAVPNAVAGFGAALATLSEQAHALQPLITPALDDVIALVGEKGHPLRAMLNEAGASLGFSSEETDWLLEELQRIEYRPVRLVCADGFKDLETLLSGISVGENGLLVAGFVRFTGDEETDARLEAIVIRLREARVTASMFLIVAIVLIAQAVAEQSASKPA